MELVVCPASLSFHTSAQCIHQIDDFRWRTLSGCFDLFTGLLFLQQLFQRILVVIFERVRIEMPGFGFDDGGTANEHDPEQRERGPQPEEATAPIALSHQATFGREASSWPISADGTEFGVGTAPGPAQFFCQQIELNL
jgi:hypothetical protein